MKHLNQNIKKHIREVKEHKMFVIKEQKILKSRMLKIFESEQNIVNFESLDSRVQDRMMEQLVFELRKSYHKIELRENDTSPGQTLGTIFGGMGADISETILERLANWILGKLGLPEGFTRSFLISTITSRPSEFLGAMKNCEAFSRFIANGLTEALVMRIQAKQNKKGIFYDYLRNAISDVLSQSSFLDGFAQSLSKYFCDLFGRPIVGGISNFLLNRN